MAQRSVFLYSNYRQLIKAFLTGPEHRGRLSKAAIALGCQPSYLSRVAAEDIHLTSDHAFNLAKFLHLNAEERRYFLLLVEFDRSGNAEYRRYLTQQMTEMRERHDSIGERSDRARLSADPFEAIYFSSWIWSALHFLVATPEFQTPAALASRLGLSETLVLTHLRQLEKVNAVKENAGRWEYVGGEFHLERDSFKVLMHHQNWRARALLDAQDTASESLHYTNVQTMSRADAARLRELMLDFIAESSRIAGPSNPEDAVVITCDLFRV